MLDIIISFDGDTESLGITLDSIKENTMVNFNILIINNSTEKQVLKYLDILQDYRNYIKVINTGFKRGLYSDCNLGVANSSGDYICFVNNIYATKNWAKFLITHFESSMKCAAVGPNQNLESIRPEDADTIKVFGKPVVHSIGMYCFLTSRKMWNRLGFFNELLFLNKDGENEWAQRQELETYMANNVYVHHWDTLN